MNLQLTICRAMEELTILSPKWRCSARRRENWQTNFSITNSSRAQVRCPHQTGLDSSLLLFSRQVGVRHGHEGRLQERQGRDPGVLQEGLS